MHLLDRFVSRVTFESYEDFHDNFSIQVPQNFNFAYDVADVYAQETPDKRALVWCDDQGGQVSYTFSELVRLSRKAANVFRDHGIRKGDHVLLLLRSRYEFWICLLGLHRLGAIAVPATHMLTAHDVQYRIESANVRMVLSMDSAPLLDAVEEALRHCTGDAVVKGIVGAQRPGWSDFHKELDAASDQFERPSGPDATTNEDIMLVYFSSGTTGYPKMVQHDFAYPLAHIITAKYWQNVEDDGLHYTVADTGWAKCAWGKIYGQWLAGSAVFVYDYEVFNAATVFARAAEFGVTTFCAPPTIYRFLIKEDPTQFRMENLHYIVTAGEPLNGEVYDKILQFTGLRLMEGFGQTEAVVMIANYPGMEPKPGSMGKPSPGYAIELLNGDGQPCEEGEEGEIVINTSKGNPPGLFVGYFRNDAATAAAHHDGYYRTGDMAWMDEDGYYWFVGRADDLIKSSGYRIGPFEVESALIQHPAVLECAVTGAPDPLRGQVVKATVILTPHYAPSEELKRELQEHVKNVTAPYKYPRIIEFASALPKTISGKIRRVQIREEEGQATE